MRLEIKSVLPYIVLFGTLAMTWGMWSERLNAVEKKADRVAEMQQDLAVIKAQLKSMDDKMGWMEGFLIKNYKEF
tara:strand:+ start:10927 stop:11151 length:225 start_codon:yes stop_codon:yes gene_type:complete